MATVYHSGSVEPSHKAKRLVSPVLDHYFSRAEQQKLIDDDLSAGRTVSAVLVSIVTLGMIVGAVTVLAITLTM